MKNRLSAAVLSVVCLAVLATLVSSQANAYGDCVTYANSRIAYISGHGYVCAYSGPGCTECTSAGNGCVTDGTWCMPQAPLNRNP